MSKYIDKWVIFEDNDNKLILGKRIYNDYVYLTFYKDIKVVKFTDDYEATYGLCLDVETMEFALKVSKEYLKWV